MLVGVTMRQNYYFKGIANIIKEMRGRVKDIIACKFFHSKNNKIRNINEDLYLCEKCLDREGNSEWYK